MQFNVVFVNVAVLVALCLPTFALSKAKMIDNKTIPAFSVLLLYVCQPFMILESFLSIGFDSTLASKMLMAALLSLVSICLGFGVALLVFRKKEQQQRIHRFASTFSNCGFFGLPLLAALFPGNPLVILYASIYVAMFNITIWTMGIVIITGDKKEISLKKALLSPSIVSILIGIPMFFLSVQLPSEVLGYMEMFGEMTSPVSMAIVGIRLAEMSFKDFFSDWRIYVTSALRLIATPMLTFLVLKLFGVADSDLFNTLFIASAMPVAASTIVFSEKFTDSPQSATKAVLLSTLLCMVTIPVLSLVFLI